MIFRPCNIGKIMESRYQSMNKKLDILITKHDTLQSQIKQWKTITSCNTQPRIINLTNTTLTKEQIKVLSLGPQYALEQRPSTYINELIIEIENAIRKLELTKMKWVMFAWKLSGETPHIKFYSKLSAIQEEEGGKTLSRLNYKNVIFSLRLTFSFTATTVRTIWKE